jgi:hypothetical protein
MSGAAANDDGMVTKIADWAAMNIQSEPDRSCRALLAGVLRFVVEGLDVQSPDSRS